MLISWFLGLGRCACPIADLAYRRQRLWCAGRRVGGARARGMNSHRVCPAGPVGPSITLAPCTNKDRRGGNRCGQPPLCSHGCRQATFRRKVRKEFFANMELEYAR
jgi:hypothetical protein